ncbi:hypothetical protein SVIOM342S_09422 [Streptomyces violaceorubidus]
MTGSLPGSRAVSSARMCSSLRDTQALVGPSWSTSTQTPPPLSSPMGQVLSSGVVPGTRL